ncbi:MAG: isoaspartyl peptidase/L-asparaginase [Lentisphaeria bacterium]|nr:isoaspartyl peptidase/L-asparaginase [Candidatus Neomarinimicrobiota bacterium]MCF7841396.1 isoaspartyl peptidase/L-asparaginase [Lentisphaeria bacterium]
MGKFAFAVHGGAGVILKENMTPERESRVRAGLKAALETGRKILSKGGSSLDAVTEAIVILEDLPEFNAGRGSVFNHFGKHEMDAALMSGQDLSTGAVASVTGVRNPVRLARAVMEKTPHVLLTSEGAEALALALGLPFEPAEYFYTEHRYKQLQQALERNQTQLDHADDHGVGKKFGTVGAVALDEAGNLAAGVSTGGMTNKKYGRIGDSPIVGAGLYADNRTCAVSATGEGEFFIRRVACHDISARMEYLDENLAQAAQTVIMQRLGDLGGSGGIIAVDAAGHLAMPYNTPGMYRGFLDDTGEAVVRIWAY